MSADGSTERNTASGRLAQGVPNKLTADVPAMILAALDDAGGQDYLVQQAYDNPKAFISLLGRIIPTQVTGKDDVPLCLAALATTNWRGGLSPSSWRRA